PQEKPARSQQKAVVLAESETPFDGALLELLKQIRAQLAEKQGGVPNYIIFSDETLRHFARIKPRSLEAARRIRGVGEMKASRYMPAFLDAIIDFEACKKNEETTTKGRSDV
ncbi:MAG: HRDC domain-containing protein, partial [Verrucomicrobia bacterium]|nr:HRDC domain-containing protein [Verrucomicrobiota bacterium]